MNENEFQFNGKTYVAFKEHATTMCECCAFYDKKCVEFQHLGKIPPCSAPDRKDGKDAIFIEKRKKCNRHLLKILKEFADAKLAGVKPWEIRSMEDRTFHIGDVVVYKVLDDPEHPLNGKEYTITFIYEGDIGLAENYCIFTDKERNESKD